MIARWVSLRLPQLWLFCVRRLECPAAVLVVPWEHSWRRDVRARPAHEQKKKGGGGGGGERGGERTARLGTGAERMARARRSERSNPLLSAAWIARVCCSLCDVCLVCARWLCCAPAAVPVRAWPLFPLSAAGGTAQPQTTDAQRKRTHSARRTVHSTHARAGQMTRSDRTARSQERR